MKETYIVDQDGALLEVAEQRDRIIFRARSVFRCSKCGRLIMNESYTRRLLTIYAEDGPEYTNLRLCTDCVPT